MTRCVPLARRRCPALDAQAALLTVPACTQTETLAHEIFLYVLALLASRPQSREVC